MLMMMISLTDLLKLEEPSGPRRLKACIEDDLMLWFCALENQCHWKKRFIKDIHTKTVTIILLDSTRLDSTRSATVLQEKGNKLQSPHFWS